MKDRLRVAVVGYGIAGASVACQLHQQGHRVERFDRRAAASGGAGMLLAPAALDRLAELGVLGQAMAAGVVVREMHADNEQRSLIRWQAKSDQAHGLGLGIRRAELQRLLIEADGGRDSLRLDLTISSVDPERGYLRSSCGAQLGPYDLVVCADGAKSRLRDSIRDLVVRQQRYTWTALSTLVSSAARPPSLCEQRFHGAWHVSTWPVAKQTNDDRWISCISVNVPGECAAELRNGSDLSALVSLLPQARPQLDQMRAIQPWRSLACYDIELNRYGVGCVVFVGDAAHCLSPQLGQGARLALDGAAVLATAINRQPSTAAAAIEYDVLQRPHARRFQRLSRLATPLFQSASRLPILARDHLLPIVARWPWVQRSVMQSLTG